MKTFLKVWLSISLIAIGFGIGLLILAAASGARIKDIDTFSMSESYQDVKSLDVEINYGNVEIVRGDEFSIFAENLVDDGIESYVTEGTWVIREDNVDSINIFGLKVPVWNIIHIDGWGDDFDPKIIITVPENFVAENVSFKIAAGSAKIEEINALTGDFKVETGELKIEELTISDKSSYSVGAGNMILKNMTAKDIIVDCGLGNVEISGSISGDNDISCGVGRVDINLNGDDDDYTYDVSSGIGNVVIDGDKYNSISNKIIKNESTENKITLDCGVGNIRVEFMN